MTWGLGQFPFLLPKKLFFPYLEGRLHDACVEELYRHAGRLRADLGGRLEESVNRYLRALTSTSRRRGSLFWRPSTARPPAGEQKSLRAKRTFLTDLLRSTLLREIDQELALLQAGWEIQPQG